MWALYARVAERYRKRHKGCDERSARLTAIRMIGAADDGWDQALRLEQMKIMVSQQFVADEEPEQAAAEAGGHRSAGGAACAVR